MTPRGRGYRKLSEFLTRAIKHFCLTFKQRGSVKCLRESVKTCRCTAKLDLLFLHLDSHLPPSAFALPLTAQPPFLILLFFCLISRSLSSRAPACPRDSESLNIHLLSSIAPPVLLVEGEGEKKEWHWIIQGPIRAISGDRLDLDEMAQRAPVFVCFDVAAPLTPCPSSARHNYRHYTIMQGSSNAYFSPDYNFPSSLLHGREASIDQLNRYMMSCKKICFITAWMRSASAPTDKNHA